MAVPPLQGSGQVRCLQHSRELHLPTQLREVDLERERERSRTLASSSLLQPGESTNVIHYQEAGCGDKRTALDSPVACGLSPPTSPPSNDLPALEPQSCGTATSAQSAGYTNALGAGYTSALGAGYTSALGAGFNNELATPVLPYAPCAV